MLHKNRWFDFHTIYRNWPATYPLYIYRNICKLNECINWVLGSKNVRYFCMRRLADKRTQWPTLFREWFCNSEIKHHEICTRSKQHAKIKVSRISLESVKFHSMKLTMMLKLNFEKLRSSTLDHGAWRVKAKKSIYFLRKWPLKYIW